LIFRPKNANLKLMPKIVNSSWFIVNSFRKKSNILSTTNYQPRTKRAFTLIELLLVIALIGLLSSFGVYSYQNSQKSARDTQRKSDLDAIKKGLESFTSDTAGAAKYPRTITASLVQGNYMQKLPTDPKTSLDYIYTPHDENGTGACFNGGDTPDDASDGSCRTYTLTTCLENDNDNGSNTLTKPISGDGSTCPTSTQKIYQINSQ